MLDVSPLGYLAVDDPVLYDWLSKFAGTFNALQKQVGVDAAASPQANPGQAVAPPASPASLSVTGLNGHFTFVIGPSKGAAAGAIYIVEQSSDKAFPSGSTTSYQTGNTLAGSIGLGSVTRYWRVRAKYPSSDYSPYTYFGTAANPTAVTA